MAGLVPQSAREHEGLMVNRGGQESPPTHTLNPGNLQREEMHDRDFASDLRFQSLLQVRKAPNAFAPPPLVSFFTSLQFEIGQRGGFLFFSDMAKVMFQPSVVLLLMVTLA